MPSADEVAPLVLALLGPLAAGLTGKAIDAEMFAFDPQAALRGDGRLAQTAPLHAAPRAAGSDRPEEAEPGRRPSPRVRRAVRATALELQRYPDSGAQLAARLADAHGVPAAAVAISGGGASELLERCLRAFCSPGDEVVSPFPTFEVLSALCSREGLRHRPVPAPRLADGLFGPHRAAPLLAAVGPRTRVVYVATPDNPTGAVLSGEEESALVEGLSPNTVLVVDEAWAGPPEAREAQQRPLLRLRSLSKLHGLAALRVGYAIGDEPSIALLQRLQLPYPLGAPQLAAAGAILDELPRARRAALLAVHQRARLADGLRALGLSVSAGSAPMLLVRDPSGRSAGRLLFALQAAGTTAQEAHWDPSAVVLALGSPAQNRRALAACARALRPPA
jgi:histidinol-phosphate aminotransferase